MTRISVTLSLTIVLLLSLSAAFAADYQIRSVTGWVSSPIPVRLNPAVTKYLYDVLMPGPVNGVVRTTKDPSRFGQGFLGGTISIGQNPSFTTRIGTFQASSSAVPTIAALDFSSYGLWLDTNGPGPTASQVNGAFTAGRLATNIPTRDLGATFTGYSLGWVREVGDRVAGHFSSGTSSMTIDFRQYWITEATVNLPQIPLQLHSVGPPEPLSIASGVSFSMRLAGTFGRETFVGAVLGQLFGPCAAEMAAVFTVTTTGLIQSGPMTISGAFGGRRGLPANC